ncbi:ABC transporter substrate-binding protein [Cellulomonas sp. HZM]|uniref:ABC transporter substrate-binding protein n=1 Tax=Cellulomonas sp. HZM TaxID=1454010 RepID=UPI00049329B8|nr:ABC transporter substrate-binding protein [Cellulomonas sp. HZM]
MRRLVALLVVLLLPLATACSSDAAASGPRHVTVVLDWTPNTNHSGLYVAQERGYFADEGLDVTIVEPGETSGTQLLAAGKADFAYSVAESIVPARDQGADVVSVATVIEHNTSSLISLRSAGITRPRDLAGHTYGTYGSKLEEALVRRLVQCDGGDPAAVKMAPLASDDFRVGLTQHQFDAAWVFDAWDTIRLRDIDHLDVTTIPFIDHTDCIPDWYTPLVATTGAHLRDDPELVRHFLAALAHGYRDSMTTPSAAVSALHAAAPELSTDLLTRSAGYLSTRYASSPDAWGHQSGSVWAAFVAFLQDNGLASRSFDVAGAWSDDYLP